MRSKFDQPEDVTHAYERPDDEDEDDEQEQDQDRYDGPSDGEAWAGGFAENH